MNYADIGLDALFGTSGIRSGHHLPRLTPHDYQRHIIPGGAEYSSRPVTFSGTGTGWAGFQSFAAENKVPVAIAGAALLGLLLYGVYPEGFE